MSAQIPAVYEHGAFIPQTPCDLPEGSRVTLTVELPEEHQLAKESGARLAGSRVTDPEERKRIIAEVVQSMLDNPLTGDAPRLTREELHERR